MKKVEIEDLQEQALKIAEAHGVDKVYATVDGNYFLPKDKTAADDHNAKNVRKHFEDAEVIEVSVPKAQEEGEEIIVTEAILEANPELVEAGVKVGDTVTLGPKVDPEAE